MGVQMMKKTMQLSTKSFPDKNIKKDTVKQDSLTQDSNLLYGVSKSEADQDVNKSAHLKAMHEPELHQNHRECELHLETASGQFRTAGG